MIGVVILGVPSLVAPFDPMMAAPSIQMHPPSPLHWFGTDFLGRDVLSRFLYGGRHTLLIAIGATIATAVPGIFLGVLAGSLRRFTPFIMSFVHAILSFPSLLFGLVIITLLGRSEWSLLVAVSAAQIAPYTKVIYAATVSIQSEEYVEAAHAIGAAPTWIAQYHILPNIQPTMLAYTAITFCYCLLNSAALNFLGLGGEPGIPDWGVMLAEGRMIFRDAPWVAFPPGLAITAIVWAINRIIDRQPSF